MGFINRDNGKEQPSGGYIGYNIGILGSSEHVLPS